MNHVLVMLTDHFAGLDIRDFREHIVHAQNIQILIEREKPVAGHLEYLLKLPERDPETVFHRLAFGDIHDSREAQCIVFLLVLDRDSLKLGEKLLAVHLLELDFAPLAFFRGKRLFPVEVKDIPVRLFKEERERPRQETETFHSQHVRERQIRLEDDSFLIERDIPGRRKIVEREILITGFLCLRTVGNPPDPSRFTRGVPHVLADGPFHLLHIGLPSPCYSP